MMDNTALVPILIILFSSYIYNFHEGVLSAKAGVRDSCWAALSSARLVPSVPLQLTGSHLTVDYTVSHLAGLSEPQRFQGH